MFLAQGNDRLDRWWWNTALPTQPETKASSSAAVKIAPSVQKDINRHGVMWRSGGWDCSSWEISDQAHEKLQHILNMIKERIGNAIRTRRLAYAVRTCTQWMRTATAHDVCHLLKADYLMRSRGWYLYQMPQRAQRSYRRCLWFWAPCVLMGCLLL